jgi:hypothetical protein
MALSNNRGGKESPAYLHISVCDFNIYTPDCDNLPPSPHPGKKRARTHYKKKGIKKYVNATSQLAALRTSFSI